MSTYLVNFLLANGETHQFLLSEPEATYEPGESLRVGAGRRRIVSKSIVKIPVPLDGERWREFCRRGLGASGEGHATPQAAAA